MGLAKPALKLLLQEHKRRPFSGSILTLDRQNIYATFNEVQQLLNAEQIVSPPLPPEIKISTNIPSWIGTPQEKYTNDVVFFHLLGITNLLTLDYSDFEGAAIVHDLNVPVPNELRERFDIIIDSGTIEHVFDVRQVFTNIASMLSPGGRVIHISPTNNYVNHGFYQFSQRFSSITMGAMISLICVAISLSMIRTPGPLVRGIFLSSPRHLEGA